MPDSKRDRANCGLNGSACEQSRVRNSFTLRYKPTSSTTVTVTAAWTDDDSPANQIEIWRFESYNEEDRGDYSNGDREPRIDVAAKTLQESASNADRPAKSEVKDGAQQRDCGSPNAN
jgi:hypothetical protein